MENDINIPPPIQPEPTLIQPKPKTRLIVLSVILGVVIAGYFVSAKFSGVWPFSEVVVSIPTFTPRPTSDNLSKVWNTYKSGGVTNLNGYEIFENLGIEFEYPAKWFVYPIEGGQGSLGQLEINPSEDYDDPSIEIGAGRSYIINGKEYKIPKEELEKYALEFQKGVDDFTREQINIGGVSAIKVAGFENGTSWWLWPKGTKMISIYFFKGDDLYSIDYSNTNGDYEKDFNQILSTFKFIESTP